MCDTIIRFTPRVATRHATLALSPADRLRFCRAGGGTGNYSDVVVIDGDGRPIPWPEVSRFNKDEMRDLMREVVNKLYTYFVKAEDPDFKACTDFVRPQCYHWDRPKIDKVMMHYVKEYGNHPAKAA